MVYPVLEFWLKPSTVKGKGGWGGNELFFPFFFSMGFLLYVALNTVWILMHKSSLIHTSDCSFCSLVFSLTIKVCFFDINLHQKKKSYLCSLLIYTALSYHSTRPSAQQKSLFTPRFGPNRHYALQILRLGLTTGWLMWGLPHDFLPWLYSYHAGSSTYHFH